MQASLQIYSEAEDCEQGQCSNSPTNKYIKNTNTCNYFSSPLPPLMLRECLQDLVAFAFYRFCGGC